MGLVLVLGNIPRFSSGSLCQSFSQRKEDGNECCNDNDSAVMMLGLSEFNLQIKLLKLG